MTVVDFSKLAAALNMSDLDREAIQRLTGKINQLFKEDLAGMLYLVEIDGKAKFAKYDETERPSGD